MSAISAARRELERGRQPIPIPIGQKKSLLKGWPELRLTEGDLAEAFDGNQNLGILNGEASGSQVDVDLDCPTALLLADRYLPVTTSVFGRSGKRRSHRIFTCSPLPVTTQFRDLDGTMLVELRSTGTQTLFPPSIHPSGEEIAWEVDEKPAAVAGDHLTAAVTRIAAACLLARHWPSLGGRHDASLALGGALLRLGWDEAEVAHFITAVAEVAGDEEARDRATTAAYTVRRLTDGQSATGWPQLARSVGAEVVDRMRQWLGKRDSEDCEDSEIAWEPPIPLTDLPRPPFPTDTCPNWVRDFVEAVAVATQTPAALPGMLSLSALSATCAPTVVVQITPDWHEPVNLFTATALPSGERKTAVYRDVVRPIVEFEGAELIRLAPEVAQAESRRKIADQALTRAQKEAAHASGAEQAQLLAKADALARELAVMDVPTLPRLIVDDCSPERLASLLAEQGGRIAVMAPEGDVFDLMAGRYSATGAPNFGVYLRGHAGDDLRVDRVGRPPEFVRAPTLTVGLAVQPEVIHGLTRYPGFRGRGLLARFLFAVPESLVGRRAIDPPAVPDPVRRVYHDNLTRLLHLEPKGAVDASEQRAPHRLLVSPAAAALLRHFQVELEPRLGELGDLGHIRDWAGKLAGAIARIAGLLHMAMHVNRQAPWLQPISAETMSASIQLGTRFLIPHAQVAFAQMGADPAVADARYILRILVDRDLAEFSKRDLFQVVKGHFKTMEPLERAIAVLEEHGYIHPRLAMDRPGPGRKPSPTFEVHPRWQSEITHRPLAQSVDGGGEETALETSELVLSHNAQNPQNRSPSERDRYCEDSEHCEGCVASADENDAARRDGPGLFLGHTTTSLPEATQATPGLPLTPVDATETPFLRTIEEARISVISDLVSLSQAVSALSGIAIVGVDCETTGLDPRLDRLRLVTLASNEQTVVIDVGAVPNWEHALAPVLTAPAITKILHHAKFDLAFLAQAGLEVPHLFDTMLASQLLDGGQNLRSKVPDPTGRLGRGNAPAQIGYHSLAALAHRELGLVLDKTHQTADWSGALRPDLVAYAAADAAVLLPLHHVLAAQLTDAGLDEVAALEFAAVPTVVWMEAIGTPFDASSWVTLRDAAAKTLQTVDAELAAVLPGINADSPTQVVRAFADLGIPLPNTQETTLQTVAAQHPAAALLLRRKEAKKRVSTYGDTYLSHVHPITGRIHAHYQLIGAASGRMACNNPNLQNIPREPAYRRCIRPSAGRVLVKADYSQIELRIAAQVSGDRAMQAAFRAGEDLHTTTAQAVLGRTPTTDDRQLAKALNFGLLYGMGASRLRSYAEHDYGVHLSEDEAGYFRQRFFATYPGIRQWHRRQSDGVIETRTLTGRIRRGVESFPEKLASPISGTGADILKRALSRMWEHRAAVPSAAPVLVVHDEIVVEVDAQDATACAAWLVEHMTVAGAQVLTDVPVTVEASIVTDWSGTPWVPPDRERRTHG